MKRTGSLVLRIRSAAAVALSLMLPDFAMANLTNVASATYRDASNTSYTATSNTVTVLVNTGGGTGAPAVPDLRSISGRTYLLADTISLTYSSIFTQMEWTFIKRGELSAASARVIAAPTGSARTPTASIGLSPLGLDPGTYEVSVRAWNGSLSSTWATANVSLASDSLAGVRVYPNPWKSGKHTGGITFNGLPANSTVKIFTVAGHLVSEVSGRIGAWTWDRKTSSGDTAASGVYLYVIEANGQKSRGKIAVIR